MSRLGDTLRKALHTAPPAMGFRPVAYTKPHMVLIAALYEAPDESSWLQGAEAVIFGSGFKSRGLKSLVKTLSVPWGIWLDSATSPTAESAGPDFAIFEPEKTGLELMSNESLGKVIVAGASCESSLLHGLSELPIEAVYLKRTPDDPLTWLDLMQCRRMADLAAKPLLVPVAPVTPFEQIRTLWEAGVDGLIVTATAENSLKNLRREMDTLNPGARRKWLRARPTVPVIAPVLSPDQHEDDEEEEPE